MIRAIFHLPVIHAFTDNWRSNAVKNNDLVLFKQTDTKIGLVVQREDRKILKVTKDIRYYINILTEDGQFSYLRKEFEPLDVDAGRLQIDISSLDLSIIPVGRYNYSLTYIDEFSKERVLLLSHNSYQATLEIRDGILPQRKPPFEQFVFTKILTVVEDGLQTSTITHVSSRLPITLKSHILHLIFDKFIGKIIIEKTKHLDPYDQEDWEPLFEVDIIVTDENMDFNIENFEAKYIRVRFTQEPDSGKLTKLLFS